MINNILKEGTFFMITYKAKKHDQQITRRGKWDNKCRINHDKGYMIYFDRDRANYRCATTPCYISIGLNKEEMKVIQ